MEKVLRLDQQELRALEYLLEEELATGCNSNRRLVLEGILYKVRELLD